MKLSPGDAAALRAAVAWRPTWTGWRRPWPTSTALDLAPDDGPTYEAMALVLARLKKYDEALAALERLANSARIP